MASSIPSVNRPVTGWVRYSGDRDWQEARFATATPVTAARFYVQNLTSGKASSIDLHRVTKMDELEWGKEGVDDLDTVEVHIAGKSSFEAMWPSSFTEQILDCLWATVDEEANAHAPDVVDLRGDLDEAKPAGAATATAWTPSAPSAEGQVPWAAGAATGGPLAAPDAVTPTQAPPPPPSGPPLASIPPPGAMPMASPPAAPAPLPPPPGANGGPPVAPAPVPAEPQAASTGKRKGWRGRRENKMSPIVGVLAVAGCALLAVGGFIMLRGDDPPVEPSVVLSETTINQSTTIAPAPTLAPGETTTTTVLGG